MLKGIKELYIKFQTIPILGFILFIIYMIVKSITCFSLGFCPVP